MTIEEFHLNLIERLPIKRCDDDFLITLKSAMGMFKSDVSELDDKEITNNAQYIKEIADAVYETIYDAYMGETMKADLVFLQKILGKGISCIKDNFIKFSQIGPNPDKSSKDDKFYRIRVASYGNRRLGIGDMFHVPLKMRNNIPTHRYSIPGLPCLYLGRSFYGCWEEMERPNFNDCMVSKIELQSPISVVDLRMPTLNDLIGEDKLKSFLMLPMIIACMVQTKNRNDIYKPEYIMPQLIMSFVKSSQFNIGMKNNIVDGVYYTSAHKNDEFDYPDYVFDCLAIPVKDIESTEDFCPELCKEFKITKPANWELDSLKSAFPFDVGYSDENVVTRYRQSAFGYLERRLKDKYKLYELQPKYLAKL